MQSELTELQADAELAQLEAVDAGVPGWLTLGEADALARAAPGSLKRMAENGRIRRRTVAGRQLYHRGDVLATVDLEDLRRMAVRSAVDQAGGIRAVMDLLLPTMPCRSLHGAINAAQQIEHIEGRLLEIPEANVAQTAEMKTRLSHLRRMLPLLQKAVREERYSSARTLVTGALQSPTQATIQHLEMAVRVANPELSRRLAQCRGTRDALQALVYGT